MNVQNQNNKPVFGVDLRGLIRAPAGQTFVVADSAQIEPRILALYAENDPLLARLRDGWNIYEAFAQSQGLFDGAKGTLKKDNARLYAMAKGSVLGLGYGMSADKFVISAPALTGGDYRPTHGEAKRAVTDFRNRNPGITGMWKHFDAVLEANIGGNLDVELPSGRVIRYMDLKRGRHGIEGRVQRGGPMKNIYGALLTENLVQGTARDCLGVWLLACREAGLDVRLHVHDEIVVLCPVYAANEVKAQLEAIMLTAPDWMPALPLGVESKITEVYCK